MALTQQDIVKGTDFTGLTEANASNLNNLADLAYPKLDTNGDGKGMVLKTHDTALDTPVVPDPSTNDVGNKWKRYFWERIPHTDADDLVPKIYGWNDNATSDATYLKWIQIIPDTATLEALVQEAVDDAAAALVAANIATTTANTANASASTALANAATAAADAATAASAAAQAALDAAAALSTANEAKDEAEAATTSAAAKKDINAALNPGTAGQRARTNSDATGVEWFNEINYYAKVSYSPDKNTPPEASATATWTKRKITVEDSDTGNLVSLAGNTITFAVPGIYRVRIVAPAIECNKHKAVLVDTDTNLVVLAGTNARSNSSVGNFSFIEGVITVTTTVKNFAVYHYTESDGGFLAATPAAINLSYNAAELLECYLVCEFWKIN